MLFKVIGAGPGYDVVIVAETVQAYFNLSNHTRFGTQQVPGPPFRSLDEVRAWRTAAQDKQKFDYAKAMAMSRGVPIEGHTLATLEAAVLADFDEMKALRAKGQPRYRVVKALYEHRIVAVIRNLTGSEDSSDPDAKFYVYKETTRPHPYFRQVDRNEFERYAFQTRPESAICEVPDESFNDFEDLVQWHWTHRPPKGGIRQGGII